MRLRQRILSLLASLSSVGTATAYNDVEVNSRIESEPPNNTLSSSSQRNRLRQHRDSLAAVERDVAEIEQQDDRGDITPHDQQLDEQLLVVEVKDDGSTARHLINQSTSDENENEDTGGNDANNRSLARQQKHKGDAPGINKQTRFVIARIVEDKLVLSSNAL